MNGKPLVSIICTTYNHETYIRKCLEGFVSQKASFIFEAIVHDDASTDNTQQIIKEYQAKYPEIIKPILQKENQYSKGVDIIGNFIMPLVQGRYIAMCEGDDFWIISDKLQRQVDYMEQNSKCSLCFTRARTVDTVSNSILPLFSKTEEKDYSEKDFITNWVSPTATMLVTREVIEAYVIAKKKCFGIWAGDRILELCAVRLGTCHCMPLTTAQYNIHSMGASKLWSNCERQLNQFKSEVRNFPEFKRLLAFHYNIQIIPQLSASRNQFEFGMIGILFFYLKFMFVCPLYGMRVGFRYLLYKLHLMSANEWPKIKI